MMIDTVEGAAEWAAAWEREGKLTRGRLQRAIADLRRCAGIDRMRGRREAAAEVDKAIAYLEGLEKRSG